MLISRKEARANGLPRYSNGKPCKAGHVCERYTSTGHCVNCDLADRAIYREKNRQIIRERGAAYREKYGEALRTRKKEQKQRRRAKAAAAAVPFVLPARQKAKPLPAPDWTSIGYSVDSIMRRAEFYRDTYREKKKTG